MNPDYEQMIKEVESKIILHWNYRGFTKLPEVVRRHGGHMQEMYLKSNSLTTVPSWIAELHSLTNLYISGNLIGELPEGFGEMSQLMVLDLSDNQLRLVPRCIGNLSNLRTLLLDNNFIKKLPVELRRLKNLEMLSVSNNRIVVLPEWIGSLPRLKELNLDNNKLQELPNRLTLAPELTLISVRVNRLKYLPLNGFLSAPNIRFDINNLLNYISYPLLFQLFSRLRTPFLDNKNILAETYGDSKSQDDMLNVNTKLYVKMKGFWDENANVTIIELPRQLLKIHRIHEDTTCSLLELALRKIYTERFQHTLDVIISPPNAKVLCKPLSATELDFTVFPNSFIKYMFNLLTNGPASICVNPQCQQPIFTEAWLIIGSIFHAEKMITVAPCCGKSCATAFLVHSSTIITTFDWHYIN